MTYTDYQTTDYSENYPRRDDVDDFGLSEHLQFAAKAYHQSSIVDEDQSNATTVLQDRANRSTHIPGQDSSHSRLSKTSTLTGDHSSRRHTRSSHQSKTRNSEATDIDKCEKTIALFGVNGTTGHYFLQLAVEAGYHVRALILPGFELDEMNENPNLTLVRGTMDDQSKIHRVIRKAAFVVCMLSDCAQVVETTPPTINTQSNYDFVQKLVPIMSRCSSCKVLLFQATAFAKDVGGPNPVLSKVIKKIAMRKTRREMLQEQDKIVKFISKYQEAKTSEEKGSPFQYIITRPSEMLWDRPSRKKLEASKSLPGLFPITNVDLAEFSLNALKMEKLYNTCPYVVQDGI